jgi:hypothetical protein
VEQLYRFEVTDEEGNLIVQSENCLTFCYAFRREMQHLLERSGFIVEALYGDFARSSFRSGGEQIWVVRKA